ncbi:glutamate-ammonia-ligase adenylyltransferase, partial [bacterium]|nr:glutamate-ammonia-ligase adenylyltransferase [bacterium]
KKSKQVPCPIVIAGLGKLGGRELNFGSDLDLLFIYEDEGVTSGVSTEDGALKKSIPNHLYFQKLYELIYTVASGITEAGYAYKIDLRLRPEGKKGAAVISLKQFKEYLEKRAETWERQALVKARAVGGDEEFGREFMDIVKQFVYASPFDKEDISQIDHVRKRIENELAIENEMKLDFKLGYGGIVDIEFIVQTLQLKYGGDIEELRTPNTQEALIVLKDEKIIEKNKAAMLLDAYLFLRKIESRLRIVHDTPLHSFAVSPDELNTLAVRMGYKIKDSTKAGSVLLKEYKKYTKNIRNIYQNIFMNLLSDET